MQIETLLTHARNCKTDADATELLYKLMEAFSGTQALAGLPEQNTDGYMEGTQPFVRGELNRVISGQYITMIRPEIRNDKLCVVVTTNRMLDGLGLQSKSWEPVADLDDDIAVSDDMDVADLANRAKELAIAHHAALLEGVGLTSQAALEAAQRSW